MKEQADALSAVQINASDTRYALEHNAEFFIQFFLGSELTYPVPKFHPTIFYLMTSTAVPRCAFAIPRDHAKTTLAKLAVVWYLLFTHYQFVIYLSNVSATAVPAVNDIIAFFESENFIAVYGRVEFKVKQDGIGFYRFDIKITDEHGNWHTKHCIIRALGAGQSIRGINIGHRRPQLAIVDDLEDKENIATEELFMKLKRWFYGTFRKCLDKFDHKIIHIGNMISNKCLLKEHCESEYWFSRIYGCLLKDGTPLWEDAWPIAKLREDFNEYLKAGMIDIWFAEMMNMPIGVGKGLIKADEIFYVPEVLPEHIEYACITIDLAISSKTWAHETVIIVHGYTGEYWQQVDLDGGIGIDPINLFDRIMILARKWKVSVVGIESIAYQASLKFVFNYLCILGNIENMLFVDLYAQQRKVQRLAPWAAMIKDKLYAITEGDFILTEQLLTFDPKVATNDDDYIDACAYIVQMIDGWLPEIIERVTILQAPEIQTSFDLERTNG